MKMGRPAPAHLFCAWTDHPFSRRAATEGLKAQENFNLARKDEFKRFRRSGCRDALTNFSAGSEYIG
jgi:hypothetical protein